MEKVNQMFNKKIQSENNKTDKIVEQIKKNNKESHAKETESDGEDF